MSARGYQRLLRELRAILDAGRQQAEQRVNETRVQTYWELGRRVLAEKLSERAGYGDGLAADLALDLGLSRPVMFRILAFARAHPRRPKPGLGWSQHVDLLAVKSDDARAFYEARALAEGWTGRQLQDAIRVGAFALVSGEEETPEGGASRAKLKRPAETTHVYAVEVTRVIDGDTVVLEIDLGFDVIRRQKMRLAGVNTEPASTEAGRTAARFVRKRLASAETMAVKTVRKEDVHGRYVGHLFYSTTPATVDATFREGKHLNAELITRGLGSKA
ncbi:MAG: DUF1016 N-terminal domain-containing protein [Myxococcales bacterium]|nr:DUF1016 N-terminal domain-containing protein [Myxococcales bacterium]